MTRHRWGEPLGLLRKTDRECINCGLVKTTRHEFEAGRAVYWIEFWRGLDQLDATTGTPVCEPVKQLQNEEGQHAI